MMPCIPLFLVFGTSSGQRSGDISQIYVPLAVLAGIIIVAWISLVLVRRQLRSRTTQSSTTFTLANLREMHRSGTLSDEEFERAKAGLSGQNPRRKSPNP
ncbi:MAG: SHOCT domain-containing protein [Planctomycetes bacterium]|jgi:peptidoglycan/LPS O-acetylase OafA/YrhL|nr:SHOCT domain-containing protein [Planctomycetota bacterium]MCP4839887.1 SHOCT domain-containing protein [Planctomycetota bacterium]